MSGRQDLNLRPSDPQTTRKSRRKARLSPGFSAILPLYSPFASPFLQSQFFPSNSGSRVPKSGSLPVVVNTPTAWAGKKGSHHARPFPPPPGRDASGKDPGDGACHPPVGVNPSPPHPSARGTAPSKAPPLEICGGRSAPTERFRFGYWPEIGPPTRFRAPSPETPPRNFAHAKAGLDRRSARSQLAGIRPTPPTWKVRGAGASAAMEECTWAFVHGEPWARCDTRRGMGSAESLARKPVTASRPAASGRGWSPAGGPGCSRHKPPRAPPSLWWSSSSRAPPEHVHATPGCMAFLSRPPG